MNDDDLIEHVVNCRCSYTFVDPGCAPPGPPKVSTNRVECECENCARLCRGRPGWFMPGEATRAAAHLGLELSEFKQRFLELDYWTDATGREIYVLSPRKECDDGNGYARSVWLDEPEDAEDLFSAFLTSTFLGAPKPPDSPCKFAGESGCMLPLDIRPRECAITIGCGGPASSRNVREKIAAHWRMDRSEIEGDI